MKKKREKLSFEIRERKILIVVKNCCLNSQFISLLRLISKNDEKKIVSIKSLSSQLRPIRVHLQFHKTPTV